MDLTNYPIDHWNKNHPRPRMEPSDIQEWARERREEARQMREGGATFREIGEALGVSPERARMIVASFYRKQKALPCHPKGGYHGR